MHRHSGLDQVWCGPLASAVHPFFFKRRGEKSMDDVRGQTEARRRFLRMLSASPLFASSHFLRGPPPNLLTTNDAVEEQAVRLLDILQQSDAVISSPDQAFDVMDFEAAA